MDLGFICLYLARSGNQGERILSPTQLNPEDPPLFAVLLDILADHPQGIKEWDLSEELRKRRLVPFAGVEINDDWQLFGLHFTLFHLLYQLQDRLQETGRGLEIHCLKIRLLKEGPQPHTLTQPDPLRDYYLDLNQLKKTGRAEVAAMLEEFWWSFGRHLAKEEAWEVLGLAPGAPEEAIKSRFRFLAQSLHPDKGGSEAEFIRLNEAKRALVG